MITIKNKKKTLEGTVEEIRKLSLSYTEKYYPSKQQLKTYLLKKYLKTSISNSKKQDIKNLINIVLSDLEKTKFLSDKFFSESKARNLIQKGTSINKIRNYLISKGIQGNDIKDTINKIKENNNDQDFFSAIKICKKRRIGPCREESNRGLFYKKDISILARSGFSYEMSKRVLEIPKDEFKKFCKML